MLFRSGRKTGWNGEHDQRTKYEALAKGMDFIVHAFVPFDEVRHAVMSLRRLDDVEKVFNVVDENGWF